MMRNSDLRTTFHFFSRLKVNDVVKLVLILKLRGTTVAPKENMLKGGATIAIFELFDIFTDKFL